MYAQIKNRLISSINVHTMEIAGQRLFGSVAVHAWPGHADASELVIVNWSGVLYSSLTMGALIIAKVCPKLSGACPIRNVNSQ